LPCWQGDLKSPGRVLRALSEHDFSVALGPSERISRRRPGWMPWQWSTRVS
jgi:hypothetical protein